MKLWIFIICYTIPGNRIIVRGLFFKVFQVCFIRYNKSFSTTRKFNLSCEDLEENWIFIFRALIFVSILFQNMKLKEKNFLFATRLVYHSIVLFHLFLFVIAGERFFFSQKICILMTKLIQFPSIIKTIPCASKIIILPFINVL
jgi:hypothetical protein